MKLRLSYKNYFSALTPRQFGAATTRFSGWLATRGHADLAHAVEEASNRRDLKGKYREMGNVLADGLSGKMDVLSADAWDGTDEPALLPFAYRRGSSVYCDRTFGEKIASLRNIGANIDTELERPVVMGEVERFVKIRPIDEASLEAKLFELSGMLAAVSGDVLDLNVPWDARNQSERYANEKLRAAIYFARMARSGLIIGRAHLPADALLQVNSFKAGAVSVWDSPPLFMNSLARMWGVACHRELITCPTEDLSKAMGSVSAHWMKHQLGFAIQAKLPKGFLKHHMHRMNVHELIFGRGWLSGWVASHERDEEFVLTKGGRSRIFNRAASVSDASVIEQGAADFQMIADRLGSFIVACESGNEVLLAEMISSNRKSILANAISVTDPAERLEYLLEQAPQLCAMVEVAPVILGSSSLKEMRAGIEARVEELFNVGESSIAEVVEWVGQLLDSPRMYSTSSALRLIVIQQVSLKARGDVRRAEMLGVLKMLLKGSRSYALERGGTGSAEVASFVARMAGAMKGTLLAKTLVFKNGHVKLGKTFDAVTSMSESIYEEINRLKAEEKTFLADVLESNASTLIIGAVFTAKLDACVQRAFVELPRIMSVISDEAGRLEVQFRKQIQDAVSLISREREMERAKGKLAYSHALSDLERWFERLPSLKDDRLEEALEKVQERARRVIADHEAYSYVSVFRDLFDSFQATMIRYELVTGPVRSHIRSALDGNAWSDKLRERFAMIPSWFAFVDKERRRAWLHGEKEFAEALEPMRRTFVTRTLLDGGNEKTLKAMMAKIRHAVSSADFEIKRFEEAGRRKEAVAFVSLMGGMYRHTLRLKVGGKYVKTVARALPDMMRYIDKALASHGARAQRVVEDINAHMRMNDGGQLRNLSKVRSYASLGDGKKYFDLADTLTGALEGKSDVAGLRDELVFVIKCLRLLHASRGSILTHAAESGSLGSYVERAVDSIPEMFIAYDDEVERLRRTGRKKKRLEYMVRFPGVIFNRALGDGHPEDPLRSVENKFKPARR